jgi:type I restriction enzyme, S subunit
MDTKALRQKILDLAIRGKLVPQDPNDEPASVLLQRIREEKERLVKEGKIKKSAKTSDTAHYENVPFEVPESWEWTTLPELCKIPITDGTHQTPTYADCSNGIPFLSSKDVTSQKINWKNVKYITKELHEVLYKRIAPQKNDILLAKNGTTGVAAIVEDDKVFDVYVTLAVIRPSEYINPKLLLYIINSNFCEQQFNEHLTGIGLPNLHLTDIKKTRIPLPPLAEQRRIVKEIEHWFSLIDIIESGKENLKSAVKQAKAKILDLAIHGKLVPQDPNDEPASQLLHRINPKAEISSDNEQYGEVPKGWCLSKVKDVFVINPKNQEKDEKMAGFVAMANISDGFSNKFCYEEKPWGTIKSGFTHFSDGDIAVAKISPCLENRKSMVLENLPNGIGAGTTELYVFRALCLSKAFCLFFFKSDYFIKQCVGTFNGVVGQQRVGRNIVEQIVFPLPPLPEQRRIVARIEQLFARLDRIEAKL